MENKIKWEDVFQYKNDTNVIFCTSRSKVKDGWLISHSMSFKNQIATGLCFLPDSNHEWDLSDKEKDGR